MDDAHARNLYIYSIVIANAKGSIATKRVKLPCNGFGYTKVDLELIDLPQIDLSKITEKVKEFAFERSYEIPDNDNPCEDCKTGNCDECDLLMMPFAACASCETFKCRSCKSISGLDTRDVLPFCELCNFGDDCATCERIKKYIENYPEEKGMIAHIE